MKKKKKLIREGTSYVLISECFWLPEEVAKILKKLQRY
jgi:hypothetical protein